MTERNPLGNGYPKIKFVAAGVRISLLVTFGRYLSKSGRNPSGLWNRSIDEAAR
jgi:hypothetical protein